jgi:hypothetical protein
MFMMNKRNAGFGAIIALLWSMVPAALAGQALADRVASSPDGYVRFQYDARPGVCGHGQSISMDGGRGIRVSGGADECDCECEEGPVRIEMRLDGSAIQDIDTEVGGSWREHSGSITDLGVVPPEEAADYLLTLAESFDGEAAKDAIFPATIARGVETWQRLLQIARNDDAREDVRTQSVFWLGQQASQRATQGLVSIIEDEDELKVRETAVFALSQRDEELAVNALIRIAREHREPQLRKQAIFWLGQRAEDPRVLALFEEILAGGG